MTGGRKAGGWRSKDGKVQRNSQCDGMCLDLEPSVIRKENIFYRENEDIYAPVKTL